MSEAAGLRALGLGDAEALAILHSAAFAAPWDAEALGDLLSQAGTVAIGREGAGFILCRVVADEAEILTLATTPDARRRGLGRRLVEAAATEATGRGATRLFLEVAEDNVAARALYGRTGFVEIGRRRAYYARPEGRAMDALVLALDLAPDLELAPTED
ncbi:MAG: ribosomal protein S18-alanine N-acetyltransferase [Brevundimonas sp.]|uniref:ribosomal protein S18-alanine N-acetyltransferase n=1 Tax=Brevundimonas sp. TaxID=1871086 RepID=UPI004034C0AB